MGDVIVYSVGLCCASACAPVEMSGPDVALAASLEVPTGLGTWRVSDDETFDNGFEMPCPCEQTPGRRHWLLVC